MIKKAVVSAVCVFLAGCAVAPFDVSQSENLVKTAVVTQKKPSVAAVEVINAAPLPPKPSVSVFDAMSFPVTNDTRDTVTADLKKYFSDSTVIDPSSNEKLVVRLEKAESYWVMGAGQRVPFFGILAVGADEEFYLLLKATLEVEVEGKVVRSYTIDKKISLPDGKNATAAAIHESYQRLIALYRTSFYSELDSTFTTRYL
ncbi:hypothetical protein [Caballeronia sp. LZ019]|uniref:hypothetical protein n=1 Tax=Caballeronia sp. LZ019 TaxID=3038555 RepID=UPI00285C28E6|nr:hypothetical protein [Caballeronia sp. LZ019]MDR5811194.1 hypothetical protein [Caballeronia sp. LZ019]